MIPTAFIHGFLGVPSDWDDVRAPSRHAVALELPLARSWHAGVNRIVSRIPEQSVLVGYSMGARLALACALRDQSRLKGLVLVSANPGIACPVQRAERRKHDQRISRELESERFDRFLQDFDFHGVEHQSVIRQGVADTEIARYAQELGTDLLVMARRVAPGWPACSWAARRRRFCRPCPALW